ncbi:MAG: hypothetical protein GWM98_06420, partial [Nitrospinaceae bacterium]|nr:hypothetical protein [Nitrospinaceae bacterium]NIR54191.1 hypothetical protein [Nitrospinaceae bacterium]NIS84606.1 hypothetical protein [Nitrospinaceae bacterium]NIT81401.1 hypothetical protein [Nitrospinaceae bacterium]NIU43685.1 hypothetical protein [Nitrospinaceae bacterium]
MLNKIKSLLFLITLIAFLLSATAGFAFQTQATGHKDGSTAFVMFSDDKDDDDDIDDDDKGRLNSEDDKDDDEEDEK